MHLRCLFVLLFLVTVARAQDVRITEFQTTNTSGITDEDGTTQPWIELWNPSTISKILLTNWTLSDGTTTWTFPAVEIMPDERMIVWASGKNRKVLTAPLHTDFVLPAGGGTLTLRQAATIKSQFNYPAQIANTSWGRDETDAASLAVLAGKYTTPTPGERNNYSGSGVAGKVIIDTSSRSFTGTLPITITQASPEAGAVIRYTTNGTMPSATSTLYSVPLNVTTTQIIRARIFKTGELPGETATEGYLLRDATTTAFSSAMPVIVLSNFGGGQPPATTDQNGFLWVWEPAAPDNRTRFTNLPTLASRVVLDRRGSSTLDNPKYNVNVEMRKSRDDDDRAASLLGFAEGSDFVVTGPFEFDRSEIHNPFMYALSNRIGRYAPGVRQSEVFFEANGGALNFTGTASGDYYGIYNIVEKIRRDENRVDVTRLDTYDNDVVGKTGGFIWKVDRLDSGDGGFSAGGQSFAYYYPKELLVKSPQRDPQEVHLTSYITSFNTALQSGTWNNPTTGYAAWLDVPAAIDHHLLNVWPMNVDGMRLSGYWHKERGGKLIAGPIWDFDRTMFCATDTRTDNPLSWRSTVSDFGTDFFGYVWWNRLFQDIEFYQKYIDRWQSLRRGAFSQANVDALLDSLNATMSAESITRDVARWGKTKRSWTRPFSPFTAMPAGQAAEIQRIKDWLQQRANFMDSQWVGPVNTSIPEGTVAAGTQVTLTGPVGAVIYYTLNGADPRPTGGGAPSGVPAYTAGTPITITATTRLRARAYKASHTALTGANNPPLVSKWSGLTNVRYSTDVPAAAGNLTISEINFHPTNPTVAELGVNPVFEDEDFEFIELKNIAATPIDLGGVKFTLGVQFDFTGDNALTLAPGASLIVAGSTSGFAARYGGTIAKVGSWTGDLDNNGEQIVLKAADGATILDFTFDGEWLPGTDGNGYTLAIYDPLASNGAFSASGNWRQSAALGGSPGADEPNRAPFVSPGTEISGNLTGIALNPVVSDDRLPAPSALTFAWTLSSGPGSATFTPDTAAATTVSFSLPGIYIARLTADDGSLTAFGEVSVIAKDTPSAWLARNPGFGPLDNDFDLDGWNNFTEFSLGLDASLPDVHAAPVTVLENGFLTMTYTRIKPPGSVVYAIEVADHIATFRAPNPGEVTEQILADSGLTQTVKVVDTVSATGPGVRFMRLKISPAP